MKGLAPLLFLWVGGWVGILVSKNLAGPLRDPPGRGSSQTERQTSEGIWLKGRLPPLLHLEKYRVLLLLCWDIGGTNVPLCVPPGGIRGSIGRWFHPNGAGNLGRSCGGLI